MKIKRQKLYLCSFFLSVFAITVLLIILRIYPFGTKSILFADMKIQYVDLFSWLQKVFNGEANIVYSFSKSLGGSPAAMFAYYLSSPLNFIVAFFSQENMEICLVILTILKVGLCGFSSSFFLRNRFLELEDIYVLALSCGFAMSQYVVSQMSNIMWLDGVYILPFMMWGVYKYVQENKKTTMCIWIVLGIIANWYTAYMNCLFIPFYFLYEQVLCTKLKKRLDAFIYIGKRFFMFCFMEGISVLLSMCFFFPVICGLQKGKGEIVDGIFAFNVNGSFLDIFRGFVIGSPGNSEKISFFCGTLCFFNAVLFFVNKKISSKERIISGMMTFGLFFCCFFKPLENIWNGFRFVYSYFYRFSYIIILFIIYLAARNLEMWDKKNNSILKHICGICILGLLVFDCIQNFSAKKLWLEVIILVLISLCLNLNNKQRAGAFLCIILTGEVILNGILVCRNWYSYESMSYREYVHEQEKLIADVKEYQGKDFARIEQTQNREKNENKTTAFFDENMAYGMQGISYYSSAYDALVHDFLVSLGYSRKQDIGEYDEPILAADSLLGVKYLLANEDYPGWKKVSEIKGRNGKQVYFNEYALPLGMKIKKQEERMVEENNPFLFQNQLFSNILGEKVELYKKINTKPVYKNGRIICIIPRIDQKGIVYGYSRPVTTDLKVYINDKFRCVYNNRLSYLVMNIGECQNINTVCFQGATKADLNHEMEFYYLDMDLFEDVVNNLKKKEAQNTYWNDGMLEFRTSAENGEYLLTTIPFEKEWKAYVNGEEITPEVSNGVFLTVPLCEGENVVTLKYHLQGKGEGIFITIFSGIILASGYFVLKRKKTKIES